MTRKEKAKQLALTLIGEDQNPQPLIEVLVDMAEWQYQKDRLEFAKLKAKEWQDGFNAGVEEKEKQMMSSAIDWVVENWNPEPHPEIIVPLNPNKYKMGDRVKVIIIEDDDN